MEDLSIIIPTLGRDSLFKTLESIAGWTIFGDQIIVINDGPDNLDIRYTMGRYSDEHGSSWIYHHNKEPLGYYGHASRNYALDVYVNNPWVWSLDDDDFAEGSQIPAIRHAVNEDHTNGWHVFKMRFGSGHPASGHTIWNFQQVVVGNIGTPMIVAPTETAARWGTSNDEVVGDGYFGDFEYAQALQAELGEPHWHEEVVALIRP